MLNRRELITAVGASLLLNAGFVTAFVKALPAEEIKEELEYHNYGYDNRNTGVCCYAYNDKGMSVHFKSSIKKYWYSRDVFGEHHMDELIHRAEAGKGLNSYINFLKRWTRPKNKEIVE